MLPSIAELFRTELAELKSYVPDQGDYAVRLDANEAPALLSDRARKRLGELAADTPWERYPDATAGELRSVIARRMNVTPGEVLVGVGSDELITLLLTACSRPRGKAPAPTIVTTTPSFVMYRLSARARGMRVMEVPLDADWDVSVPAMLRAIEISEPSLVFVASPNNPTGTSASSERVEQVVAAAAPALVVIDEAYVDYADANLLELYRKYDNVLVLRTLSKVGFAALRVGWLVARPAINAELNKVRLPYNLNSVSQRLATAVLSELPEELERTVRAVVEERGQLLKALAELPRVSASPAQANFVWLQTERPAAEVFQGLAERGVLVRSFHERGGRLAHQLRVTVGTPQQNQAFLQALGEVA